jgi:glycine/D-amino acid oxidase-like deaminating enzyme
MVPKHSPYVIIGAGIHGLSSAYHLALELKAQGRGDGRDIIVIDKSGVGAGATGIACGVIRNNYFQPAMRELMAHSVSCWESDPETYSYNSVGYMQISPESMHADVASIYQQQQSIGYESVFIEGENDSLKYMKGLFHDWQAKGITSVLHEKRGGYANNKAFLRGLAAKAEHEGVRIVAGVEVKGFKRDADGVVTHVETNQGSIATDFVIVGVGPWVNQIWSMLELPKTLDVKNPNDGSMARDVAMWTYWSLQEGTLGVDPKLQVTNEGKLPPVIHLDTDAPLYSDRDGSLITDQMWGIYYKPDFHFGGVQGGAQPYIVQKKADSVAVDPYGPESPEFIVGEQFSHMWVSAMAFCQKRFEGTLPVYKDDEPSGGIGCFTPDSFPVFDRFRKNCYIIADSNHGFKMLGVGQLVAREILGQPQELLKPFAYSRFAEGKLHPVSNSPFPWS